MLEDARAGADGRIKLDVGHAARAIRIGFRCAEDAGAYRCHLGTMRGAHDSCHKVAAKGGARLMQQAGFLVHLEYRAVGGKARLQAHGDARRELAAKVGGAVENHLGAILTREGADPVGEDA